MKTRIARYFVTIEGTQEKIAYNARINILNHQKKHYHASKVNVSSNDHQ